MRRILVVGFVVAAGWLLAASAATAHAYLVRADPAPGGRVRQPSITLHFTEGVDSRLSSVAVNHVPVTSLQHAGSDAASLVAAIPAGIANGPVEVEWKSVSSDDGHVLSGAYHLDLELAGNRADASAPAARVTDGSAVSVLFSTARTAGYLAMALLCGGLVFLVVLWPAGGDVKRSMLVLWLAWAAGLAATLVGIGLEGAYVRRSGIGSAFSPSVLGDTLSTHVGTVWAVRAMLYVLAVPVLLELTRAGARALRSVPWLVGAAAVSIALLRTPGLVAHTAEGRWAWLGTVADLAHLIGVAVWVGGLAFLCLVLLPRRRPDELEQVVPRFSKVALGAVATVTVAGTFMSWQVVASVHGLTATYFGRLVLLKVGILVVALGAALFSKHWAERRLTWAVVTRGHVDAVRPFVVSVVTETALAIVVIAVASVLVNASPR